MPSPLEPLFHPGL
jgi:hypothetical protein